MGKSKKRKAPLAASGVQKPKENPFEALHAKSKFAILGRESKGQQKNVNKARSQAVDRRRKTLLVEYKQLKKANAFIDRRFGEHDEALTEDEKAIARFQAQRLKQARKNKFTLADEEEASTEGQLTHLGNPLTQLDDFKDQVEVDDNDELDDDMVRQFHFGGGDDGKGGNKSKKEIMEEIIAKSKTYKAAKRLQKDEDDEMLQALDAQYNELMHSNALAKFRKPMGANKDASQKADNEEDGRYDIIRREMVFEGRGKAGERQLSAEELLAKEQERLAKLEKARVRRMNGEEAAEEEENAAEPAGGYAARRLKARKQMLAEQAAEEHKGNDQGGAEDEDDFESGSEESGSDDEDVGGEGISALDARRIARAAGDHPLQHDFRATSAALLLKHGLKPSEQSMADLEAKQQDDDDDDDEDDDEEEDDDEDEDDDDEDEDDDDEEEDGDEGEGDGLKEKAEEDVREKKRKAKGAANDEAEEDAEADKQVLVELEGDAAGSASDEEADDGAMELGDDDEDAGSDGDEGSSSGGEEDDDETMAMLAKVIEAKKRLDAAGTKEERATMLQQILGGDSDDDDDDDDEVDDDGEHEGGGGRPKTLPSSETAPANQNGKRSRDEMDPVDDDSGSDDEARDRTAQPSELRERRASGKGASTAPHSQPLITDADGPLDIPFTIAAPKTYAEFAALVAGRSASDIVVIVQRIRAFNAAALAADSKLGLQLLYGILLQHFAVLAGARPLRVDALDALVKILVTMTAEVPLYAATVARARLAAIHQRMAESLQDATAAVNSWPPIRSCLLMHLFATLFPTSDRKHAVLTPLSLIAGHALSFCPPNGPHDITVGLFLAGLLLSMAAPAKRHVPEVIPFCEALLVSALPRGMRTSRQLMSGHLRVEEGWLHNSKGHGARGSSACSGLDLVSVLSKEPSDAFFRRAEFRSQALCCCFGLVRQALENLAGCDALPAVMQPLVVALKDCIASAGLAGEVLSAAESLLADIEAETSACLARRRPLVHPAMKATKLQKLFNPRYEVDFDKHRDYDPDRERAQERKDRRMFIKEMRGVKREVARDAAFMGEVRRKEREHAAAARDKTQKKAIAFLEQQQADFKSGGQAGMNPHKAKRRKEK